jgi:hypothetical protein
MVDKLKRSLDDEYMRKALPNYQYAAQLERDIARRL